MATEIGYFTIAVPDDIRAAVAKVRALGGKAVEPSESKSGWCCLCHDNQGIPFDLWQPAPGF